MTTAKIKTYEELLKEAPCLDWDKFIDFIRFRNKVVFEDDIWIIIQNYKYHTKKNPSLIAFIKKDDADIWWMHLGRLIEDYGGWEWIKKPNSRQTISFPHVFLNKKS